MAKTNNKTNNIRSFIDFAFRSTSGQNRVTSAAIGEESGSNDSGQVTTQAVGEEGGSSNGGGQATTQAVGEEIGVSSGGGSNIHPGTFSEHYVALRKAMQDGKVTKREVEKYIVPHFRNSWSDDVYRNTLMELGNGSTQVGSQVVRATKGAQQAIEEALAWE